MSTQWLTNTLIEDPIVVTGMGSVTACAHDVESFHTLSLAAESPATWFREPVGPQGRQVAVCAVEEIALTGHHSHALHKADRATQLAASAAEQALAQADLLSNHELRHRGTLIVGSSRGPLGKWLESHQDHSQQPRPNHVVESPIAAISGGLAFAFGLDGPSTTRLRHLCIRRHCDHRRRRIGRTGKSSMGVSWWNRIASSPVNSRTNGDSRDSSEFKHTRSTNTTLRPNAKWHHTRRRCGISDSRTPIDRRSARRYTACEAQRVEFQHRPSWTVLSYEIWKTSGVHS